MAIECVFFLVVLSQQYALILNKSMRHHLFIGLIVHILSTSKKVLNPFPRERVESGYTCLPFHCHRSYCTTVILVPHFTVTGRIALLKRWSMESASRYGGR